MYTHTVAHMYTIYTSAAVATAAAAAACVNALPSNDDRCFLISMVHAC